MIRAGTTRDVASIVAIEHACFAGSAWSAAQLTESLAVQSRRVWIDEPDAYAMVSTAGEVADLERIAVAPAARRRGSGRRLLRAVTAQAAADGAHRVLLEVAADNAAALALYRAAGGTVIDRRRDYYGRDQDALVLQIEVAS